MGLYVIISDAIRIMIPRDLHIGSEDFDQIQIGDKILAPGNVSVRHVRKRGQNEQPSGKIGRDDGMVRVLKVEQHDNDRHREHARHGEHVGQVQIHVGSGSPV